MKEKIVLVNCEAIQKELEDVLPKTDEVLNVWGGHSNDDGTKMVYVKLTQNDDDNRCHYTKVTLNAMRKVLGEIYDVEITENCSIEFGFALPLTSKYIIRK